MNVEQLWKDYCAFENVNIKNYFENFIVNFCEIISFVLIRLKQKANKPVDRQEND